MRITPLITLFLAVAAPLAAQAQAQHKIVILSGDTLVTIERGARDACTVKIGERTLPEQQATELCERKSRNVHITSEPARLIELEGLRERLRSLDVMRDTAAVLSLRNQEALVARELAAQSRALRDQSRVMSEQNAARSAQLFENLARVTSQGSIIGVSIDPRPRETDRWGAYVAAVTPGYPAERAGIRAGDIIARIDGQSLTAGRTERAVSDDESLVWLRLSEIVRKLEPGKAVELQYRRDDQVNTTRVTPVEDQRWLAIAPGATTVVPRAPGTPNTPELAWRFVAPNDENIRSAAPFPPGSNADVFFTFGSPIANLELAPVNEKLGAYFGTTRGVLVITAPAERNLSLEPGDVVTAIDGRTVDTPAEFIRALRSYDRGKSFTLQVTRQKQRQSITTSLP